MGLTVHCSAMEMAYEHKQVATLFVGCKAAWKLSRVSCLSVSEALSLTDDRVGPTFIVRLVEPLALNVAKRLGCGYRLRRLIGQQSVDS